MSDKIVLTILGSGSSAGVPRLGGPDQAGDWGKCDPTNPKNRRTRASALVERHSEAGVTRVLIDTAPDLREQLLKAQVAEVDAVLLTHDHADQLHGFDDLRQIAHFTRRKVHVYADAQTAKNLMQRFGYCFTQAPGSSYPPITELNLIPEPFQPFEIQGRGGPLPVQAFGMEHGDIRALGYRFGPIAYAPDVNRLDDTAFAALDGCQIWVVDALRRNKAHPTHAHVELALEWIAKVKPNRGILTNLSHSLDYDSLKSELPAGVEPAYDGMRLTAEIEG